MNQKADVFPRILAFMVDGLIAWLPFFIPVIGGVFGSLYLLFKDGIMYQIIKEEEWKNRSIGKKILNLEIETLDGEVIDLVVSAKRNLPLTIGNFIAIVPVIGWIIGPTVALILAVVELIVFLTNDDHRRLGDLWANTKVVKAESVDLQEKIIT
ncbi:RDD family protein [Halanaerobium saccharolyticum]|uniref:RDD family protein n=1 Tax=Halanaerobium saccharolyticum TaxID=43595 RepID=UPI003FCE70A1